MFIHIHPTAYIMPLHKMSSILFLMVLADSYHDAATQYNTDAFAIKPINQAKKVGERVEFICEITYNKLEAKQWSDLIPPNNNRFGGIRITFYSNLPNRDPVLKLYEKHPRLPTFEFLGDDGDFAIKSVTPGHAGVYQCNNYETDVKIRPHLIVLESDPTCVTNYLGEPVEVGDRIWVSCSLNYTGLYGPDMEWKDADGRPIFSEHSDINETTTYTFKHTATYGDVNNTFEIVAFYGEFPEEKVPIIVSPTVFLAKNQPDYMYTYKLPKPAIHYGPKNLKFNASGYLVIGSYLKCTAEASPGPISYTIFNGTDDSSLSMTNILKITKGMSGNQIIGCRAKSTVKESEIRTNVTTEQFEIGGKMRASTVNTIVIVASTFLALCCVILIVFLCRNRLRALYYGTSKAKKDLYLDYPSDASLSARDSKAKVSKTRLKDGKARTKKKLKNSPSKASRKRSKRLKKLKEKASTSFTSRSSRTSQVKKIPSTVL